MKAFISHSKSDPNKQLIGLAIASAGLQPVFMEYETVGPPAYKKIRDNIRDSKVVFVILNDILHDEEKGHTRNWIDFEVGIACDKSLDVWVIEPSSRVDYAIPYVTHQYVLPDTKDQDESTRILKGLIAEKRYDYEAQVFRPLIFSNTCSNMHCGITFEQLNKEDPYICPSCRKKQYTPIGALANIVAHYGGTQGGAKSLDENKRPKK